MYKTLVVGTDGSPTADKAVQAAAELARSLSAALHIVTAFRAPRPGMGAASGVAMVDSGAGQALAEESALAVGEEAIAKFGDGLVAAVLQTGGLLKDLTVAETVRLTATLFPHTRPVAISGHATDPALRLLREDGPGPRRSPGWEIQREPGVSRPMRRARWSGSGRRGRRDPSGRPGRGR